MLRLFTLVVGPPLIVGLAWIVARPDGGQRRGFPAPEILHPGSPFPGRDASPVAGGEHVPKPTLIEKCQRTREELMRRLGTRFSSIVHPPFVILGDVDKAQLERHYRETIGRAARAMAVSYFDTPPDEPIAIVLLSDDETYQSCVERLDGERRAAFAGYYQRNDHRLVVNLSTGDGTIAHELAHALGHFDFPAMPEWFDEGLASLHEEARFSKDQLRIVGIPNWRRRYLVSALENGTLRSLESLVAAPRVRPNEQAIDYAHARYFCLFLQERGLLEPFYRKFRFAVGSDPTGAQTLHALFDVPDLASIDGQFRDWVLAQEKTPSTAEKGESRPQDEAPDERSPDRAH